MTQAQLAKAAALSQRTLVNIETNRVHPHFSTILKIAEALGVEPSELVDKE
jgi:DNA-binding XRE family transcriptional regulator